MLEPIMGSTNRERVLVFLLAREEGYARQIARFFETDLYPVQDQLEKLEAGGVIVSRSVGRTRLYEFNPRYAFLEELPRLAREGGCILSGARAGTAADEPAPAAPAGQARMKPIGEMDQAELAAYVQTHLREKGIQVVLSGGAATVLYTSGAYVSMDIDLVNVYLTKRGELVAAMEEIGFSQQGRHFGHPGSAYFVEFPSGPLAIGNSPVREIHEIVLETGLLRVISPTECVKDRLVQYYHWGDRQCLAQAEMVAVQNHIDLEEIEAWSRSEGKLDAFKEFKAHLGKS